MSSQSEHSHWAEYSDDSEYGAGDSGSCPYTDQLSLNRVISEHTNPLIPVLQKDYSKFMHQYIAQRFGGSDPLEHLEDVKTESISLSQVRDDLLPGRGCNTRFFRGCSDCLVSDIRLWRCMTKSRVALILADCGLDLGMKEREELAQTICGTPRSATDTDFISYRKLFAIMIYLRSPEKILDFIRERLHDNLLPLRPKGDDKNPTAICLPQQDDCHPCFDGWGKFDMAQFLQLQQQLCPPFFKQQEVNASPYHYKFPIGVALPLLEYHQDDDKKISGGGEEVTKVELPEEHGDLKTYNAGKKRVFAVKRLLYSNRKRFEQEITLLDGLNKSAMGNSNGISTVISATFEVGPSSGPNFYLLFPCTDCNLPSFWTFHSSADQKIPKFSKWMVEQLCGLAQALKTLRDFNTRIQSGGSRKTYALHGTIKPDNILLFGNWDGSQSDGYGVLQLADFGFAKSETRPTDQLVVHNELRSYCPPEGDLHCTSQQSVEVWELGCLFLEFIVWLVAGATGLREFRSARESPGLFHPNFICSMFYQMTSTSVGGLETGIKIEINDGVKTWVDRIHNSQDSTGFIHDFTDFILRDMLCLGSIDPDKDLFDPDTDLLEALEPAEGSSFADVPEPSREHRHRIDEDALVKALTEFVKEDNKYFQTPASYVGKGSFMPAPVYLSTTIEQVVERVALLGHKEWLLKTNRYGPSTAET